LLVAGSLLGRRIRVLIGLTNAVTGEKEDLGVLYESVCDRGCNRGVVQDVSALEKAVFVVMMVERL